MPVIAQSEPIIMGGTPSPTGTPTRTPKPARTPKPTRTQGPTGTPQTGFAARHQQFLGQVDAASSCFKQDLFSGFAQDELTEHLNVAMMDKYLVQSGDQYCSLTSIRNLVTSLKRAQDENITL